MQPTYLSVKAFSEKAHVSTQAIYKRMATDLQPYVKMDGKIKTIDIAALKFFVPFEPQPMQPLETTETTRSEDFLMMQLTARDKQIERLLDHIRDQDKHIKEIATPEPIQPQLPTPEKKKPFWKFWE